MPQTSTKKNTRLGMTGWERNCARDSNLIIPLNGICTN